MIDISRFTNIILHHRNKIIAVTAVLACVFIVPLFSLEVETQFDNYLPYDMPIREANRTISKHFGSNEGAILLFESEDLLSRTSLLRFKNLTNSLDTTKQVQRFITPFSLKHPEKRGSFLRAKPLIPALPRNAGEKEKLRIQLVQKKALSSIVFDKEFRYAVFYIDFKPETTDIEGAEIIEKLLKTHTGRHSIHYGGMLYVRNAIQNDINRDMAILLPVGILVMLLMLFFLFKQKRGVLLPFVVVLISILVGMSCLPLLGWKVSVITILLPILTIAIANDYGIHLLSYYQELNHSKSNFTKDELATIPLLKLTRPILITGITTIIGLLGLLSHFLLPAKQLGILAGISIFVAVVLSLLFIPAVVSKLSNKKKVIDHLRKTKLDIVLYSLATLVVKRPKQLIALNIVVLFVSIWATTLVVSDANVENFFAKSHPVRQSTEIIKNNFGGTQIISILFEGKIDTPDQLNRFVEYEEEITNIEGVGSVTSIGSIVKQFTKVFYNKKSKHYDQIPNSQKQVDQIFQQFKLGNSRQISRLLTQNNQHAQLLVRLKDASTPTILRIREEIESLVQNDPNYQLVGGTAVQQAEIASTIISGQITSLLVATVTITFLVMILFRSVGTGLLAGVPMLFSLLLLFGIMGLFGIRLDIATAMLSSIMIGIGIDYTIHILWRFRQELAHNSNNWKIAMTQTLTSTGRGVVFNALSVMTGFSITLLSAFTPIRFFGLLIIISIFSCLMGAILLVPSIIMLIKPKFLETEQ